MNDSFIGIDRIKLVAKDSNETFSDVITVTVVVMENKCIHGSCKSNVIFYLLINYVEFNYQSRLQLKGHCSCLIL